MNGFNLLLVFVAIAASIAGCAAPRPYVHRAGEFNRDDVDFGKDISDIARVTVCYRAHGTKPKEVVDVAVTECGRFNKRAEFARQTSAVCPLTSPMAAIYECIGDDEPPNSGGPVNVR